MTVNQPPLAGLKAVSLASLGPGPYAAMLLADLGCDVVIVDRVSEMATSLPQEVDPRRRGQRSIALDLKNPAGLAIVLDLIRNADVLMEGMRPGVAEKLGLAPDHCLALNPRLVYARITGWGQEGPLSRFAGHDINYIALSGALLAMGEPDRPPPVPLNLLGDYAGGGMFVALGIVSALFQATRTGRGQVLDGAIIDGVASLAATTMGMLATGRWGGRGDNVLDGGAPYYRTYATSDGGYMAVGAIEPQFYSEFLRVLGLSEAQWPQSDRARWPALRAEIGRIFASEDRATWEARFATADACVTPVLSFAQATGHPHHGSRQTYVDIGGIQQPAPGPRFGAWQSDMPHPPPAVGADSEFVLRELGRDAAEISELKKSGVVA